MTSPLPSLPADFPFVLFFGQSLYFHPESGRSILTGKSSKDEPVGFNLDVDPAWTQTHLLEAMERFAEMEERSADRRRDFIRAQLRVVEARAELAAVER